MLRVAIFLKHEIDLPFLLYIFTFISIFLF